MWGSGTADEPTDGLAADPADVHSRLGRELDALNRAARLARIDMMRLLDHYGLAPATEVEIDAAIAADDALMLNDPARRASFERWKARNLPRGRTSK